MSERGQALVLGVALLGMIVIIAMVVLDLGFWCQRKAWVQNAVDSAALAGAMALPDEDAALESAIAWGEANGLQKGDLTIEFIDEDADGAADVVTVTAVVEVPALNRLLPAVSVHAVAAARKGGGLIE